MSKKRFFQRGEENTIKRISNDDPGLKIKIKKGFPSYEGKTNGVSSSSSTLPSPLFVLALLSLGVSDRTETLTGGDDDDDTDAAALSA